MHVVVFGGAFDPLHNGHVDIVRFLCKQPEIDRLCMIPTGIPVHKKASFYSSHVRIKMLRTAFGAHPLIDILDLEITKQQPSYTIDTVHQLCRIYEATSISLVVGLDQCYQFHRWRKYDQILNQCNLWVVPRDGMNAKALTAAFPPELLAFKHRIQFLNLKPANISSTRVRMMIQQKASLDGVVPASIIQLLEKPYE